MKIIKEGDLSRLIPWYLKKVWRCHRCGCEFTPERLDEEEYFARTDTEMIHLSERDAQRDTEYVASMMCPTCGVLVQIVQ